MAQAMEYSKGYSTNNVMFTMGADFTYSNAIVWFKNMDKVLLLLLTRILIKYTQTTLTPISSFTTSIVMDGLMSSTQTRKYTPTQFSGQEFKSRQDSFYPPFSCRLNQLKPQHWKQLDPQNRRLLSLFRQLACILDRLLHFQARAEGLCAPGHRSSACLQPGNNSQS